MKQMKRILIAAMALCMAMALCGCSRFFEQRDTDKKWEEEYDYGMDCMDDEEYEDALDAFLEAIDIDPEKPEAYSAAAEAYMELDDMESAIKILEEGIEETDDEDLMEELLDLQEDAGLPVVQPGADAGGQTDAPEVQVAVTDAYTHFLTSKYGEECCYHIPQVVLAEDRGSEINEIIYDELYDILEDDVLYESNEPTVTRMQYSWGYGENTVSILVRTNSAPNDYAAYYTYHVSAKSGKILDDSYLIMAFDLSKADYNALLEQRVREYYDSVSATLLASVGEEGLQELVGQSVAEENLAASRPYVGADGNLCAIVKIYWPAGAGSYYQLLNVTGSAPAAEPGCTGNHGGSSIGQVESDQNPDNTVQEETQKETSARQESPYADVQVGDIITFGSYEQDGNRNNGAEAISWRVLAKENGRILVISEYGLDCKQYHTSLTSVTWENCYLRQWLNGSFYDEAFTEEEKALIPTVLVTAEQNPYYNNAPSNDTYDQVFVLSASEANSYFRSNTDRMCYATAYAKTRNNCYVHPSLGSGWWWLRDVGEYTTDATCVNTDGRIDYKDGSVNNTSAIVRPAMWIDCE